MAVDMSDSANLYVRLTRMSKRFQVLCFVHIEQCNAQEPALTWNPFVPEPC